ncbi:MAG: MBL fold metallo-hydrolase [Dehalococcoidia bacterium]|nr:MBL fold metallo-hydrolase [Dehalococcoidia bacterium]
MSPPHTYRLGDLDLHILSDGTFYQDAGAVFGIVPRLMWERVAPPMGEQYRIPLGLNCVLVRSAGKTVLIETGVGDKEGHRRQASPASEGNLLAELAALGVRPEEVDIVVNTHLHADHCGWNTRAGDDGRAVPTFPRARYLIQQGEWEAATHPSERTRATYLAENLLPLEAAGVLELIDGELSLTPEITILPTRGHTEDHASVVLSSGGETAIYIGDMVQHHVQLERTAWVSAFDVLPLISMETKKRIVERAIRERALIVSVHSPYPGLGRMTLGEDGRRHWDPVA